MSTAKITNVEFNLIIRYYYFTLYCNKLSKKWFLLVNMHKQSM